MKRLGFRTLLMLIVVCALSGCTRSCGASGLPGESPGLYLSILPVLNADKGFQFPPGFPPDPGPEGKRTQVGIDSDHDGLRDDVQRWIYARFPNDERKRKALRQMALVFTYGMEKPITAANYLVEHGMSHRAFECLYAVFPEVGKGGLEMEYVRAKVLNTYDRTQRYLENDRAFDGKVFEDEHLSPESACD